MPRSQRLKDMRPTTTRWHVRSAQVPVLGLLGLLGLFGSLGLGCSTGAPESTTRGTVAGSTAAGTRPGTTAPPIRCDGDGEIYQDDPEPGVGVIVAGDLPAGSWTPAITPPCPWAFSADEILASPRCRRAATAAGKAPNEEDRNGNAHLTWARADGVQLDERIEIYTSSQNVDAIRAILPGPELIPCVGDVVHRRLASLPGASVADVAVAAVAVQPDGAALGLGFPAVAGYAADAGFAYGVDVSFTLTDGGRTTPIALRSIAFGAGGAMGTLTLTGSDLVALRSIDLAPTLRAAASNFHAMFDPNR